MQVTFASRTNYVDTYYLIHHFYALKPSSTSALSSSNNNGHRRTASAETGESQTYRIYEICNSFQIIPERTFIFSLLKFIARVEKSTVYSVVRNSYVEFSLHPMGFYYLRQYCVFINPLTIHWRFFTHQQVADEVHTFN